MKILITGGTGFIGRHIVRQLNIRKYDLSLIIRPGTSQHLLKELPEKAQIISVDLRNIKKLRHELENHSFDAVIHLGAIRNRPHITKEDYSLANVDATEQLALMAMKCQAKFIYFSSVGVFGTIPKELPATENTPRLPDTIYHQSKIRAEAIIDRYVLYGLKSVVIRPAITYGSGDLGFAYHLIRCIDRHSLMLPKKAPRIHLTNVELLTKAVQQLLITDYKPGSIYNIADSKEVSLLKLTDFINQQLKGKNFPRFRIISNFWFDAAVIIFRFFKAQGWQNRFLRLGSDWYYDVEKAYDELNLKKIETVPALKSTIDWYKKLKEKK